MMEPKFPWYNAPCEFHKPETQRWLDHPICMGQIWSYDCETCSAYDYKEGLVHNVTVRCESHRPRTKCMRCDGPRSPWKLRDSAEPLNSEDVMKEGIHIRDGENYFPLCRHLKPLVMTKDISKATCQDCLVTKARSTIALVVALDGKVFECDLATGKVKCWEDALSDGACPRFVVAVEDKGDHAHEFSNITEAATRVVELCGWRSVLFPDADTAR